MKKIDQHHADIMDLKNIVRRLVAKSEGDLMTHNYLEQSVNSLHREIAELRTEFNEYIEIVSTPSSPATPLLTGVTL